jgi:hypothetical protein
MSTSPVPPLSTSPTAAIPSDQVQIKIVSHSMLFYWWPVWLFGFALGIGTLVEGQMMALVPHGTEAYRGATVHAIKAKDESVDLENRDVLVLPSNMHLQPTAAAQANAPLPPPAKPHLRIHPSKNLGVLFVVVLLLVIVITSVPLRGLWSVITILVVVMGSIILALTEMWEKILESVRLLEIHINAGGYLSISLALFLAWLVTVVFFDQQIYMVFTPGQLKVRLEIGGGETAYDTIGMVIQKQRDDLFRHWILGLGSGDLMVRTSGANQHEFHLPNVLFIGRKLQQIENMQRERPIARS